MTAFLKNALLYLMIGLTSAGLFSCASLKHGSDPSGHPLAAEALNTEEIFFKLSQLENTQQLLETRLTSSNEQVERLARKVSSLENQVQTLTGKKTDSQAAVVSQNPPSDPETLYRQARNLLLGNNFSGAIELFQTFIDTYPDHELADNAMYWMGECYYSMAQFNKAIAVFQELVSRYPKGIKVPDALLKTGYAYITLKDFNRAQHFLKRVITRYPFSDAADKAQKKLDTFN